MPGAQSASLSPAQPQPAQAIEGYESSVQANGITLAYQSLGAKNSETVFLIMGSGGQLTSWPVELCAELVKRGLPGGDI